jgi:hypothetical protein
MMGIHRVHGCFGKRNGASQISPYITCSRKHVGVHIDPPGYVSLPAWAKMHLDSAGTWSTRNTMGPSVRFHGKAGYEKNVSLASLANILYASRRPISLAGFPPTTVQASTSR